MCVVLYLFPVLRRVLACRVCLAKNMRDELATEGITADIVTDAPYSIPTMCQEAFRRV